MLVQETGQIKKLVQTDEVWGMTGDSKQPNKLLIRLSGDNSDIECEFDSGLPTT